MPTLKNLEMEKDILIQNLRAKVGEDDCKAISDKTFEGIATVYLPQFADDDKITDETWKYPIAALKEFAGQKRHDNRLFAEKFKGEYASQHEKDVQERINKAVADAIEDYKQKHPEKSQDADADTDEDLNAKISEAVSKAIGNLTGAEGVIGKSLANINSFVEAQKEREKAETKLRVKAELKKHLVDLKANNEACIDDALDDIDYGESPTFEGLKQSAISAYESRYKRYYADGGAPFGGSGSGDGGGDDTMKRYIDRAKSQAEDAENYASEIEFAK